MRLNTRHQHINCPECETGAIALIDLIESLPPDAQDRACELVCSVQLGTRDSLFLGIVTHALGAMLNTATLKIADMAITDVTAKLTELLGVPITATVTPRPAPACLSCVLKSKTMKHAPGCPGVTL